MPLYAVLVSDSFGPRIMGTTFGAVSMFANLGMALGPWAGGYVFDTYGSFPLQDLLAEFGLSRDDLAEEAVRFGPPALAALTETGELSAFVRRQLARFYDSPEAQAALSDG